MVTKTLPELDLELSRSGTNAYYCDFCPHTGNRPNYAACLKRIHNVQEGNEREVDAVCVVAIHRHHCEAAEMREREIEAGKALYYIDRSEMRKQVGKRLAKQGISISSKFEYKLKLTNINGEKPEKEIPVNSKGNYSLSDAINTKLKKNSLNTKDVHVESQQENKVSANLYNESESLTVPSIESGLSLLEIANRFKANTQEKL